MTRVYHVRSQQAPQRSGTLDQSRANVKKKKPYKILLEAVTQEKKKLHSILTYASNAPIGFGFIPAGHPEFTEWCKEQCRQRNLDVHVVSAKPKNKTHSDPEKLSHHVHRVGHHFPIHIIELACSKFGYIYDERRGLRKDKKGDRTNWIAQEFEDYSSRQVQHGHPATAKETKGYIHGAVREMFPKIPEADLQAIVSHAFEEGTNRVGNAKELSLARRVQLAVVAHIRHTYTDYDKLLKTDGWSEARSQVEKVSLAKLKEWRDEDGKQSDELEETFREVIVLDDDDDDASSDEGSMSTPDEREQSMEIVSSRATARDLQPESHTNYSRVDAYDMRRAPRRTIVLQRYPPPAQPAGLSGSSHSQSLLQQQPFQSAQARTTDPRARPAEAGHSLRSAQPIVREINGQLYQLQPIKETLGAPRSQYDPSPHPAPRRVQEGLGQPLLPRHSALDRPPTQIRRPSDQDVVIPSVEPETIDLTSPRRAAASQQPVRHYNANVTRPYNEVPSPKRKALPSFANDSESYSEQHTKRLRPVYREEVDSLNYHDGPARFHSSQRMAPNNGPRAPPREKIIDLTTSPHHMPTSGGRGYDVPAHSFAAADTRGHAYALGPSHRMPVREVRGAQYDMPAVEPSRTYMPDNRVYERRAPPNHDYVPLREDQQPRRLEEESARYLRNGVRYGG